MKLFISSIRLSTFFFEFFLTSNFLNLSLNFLRFSVVKSLFSSIFISPKKYFFPELILKLIQTDFFS